MFRGPPCVTGKYGERVCQSVLNLMPGWLSDSAPKLLIPNEGDGDNNFAEIFFAVVLSDFWWRDNWDNRLKLMKMIVWLQDMKDKKRGTESHQYLNFTIRNFFRLSLYFPYTMAITYPFSFACWNCCSTMASQLRVSSGITASLSSLSTEKCCPLLVSYLVVMAKMLDPKF